MLICPVCSHKMDEIAIGDIIVNYCRSGCKGIWFDWQELSH